MKKFFDRNSGKLTEITEQEFNKRFEKHDESVFSVTNGYKKVSEMESEHEFILNNKTYKFKTKLKMVNEDGKTIEETEMFLKMGDDGVYNEISEEQYTKEVQLLNSKVNG